jgi:HEAT repeat protein
VNKRTRHEEISAKYFRHANRAKGREQRLQPNEIDDLLRLTTDKDARVRCKAAQALCPCHVRADHDRIWDRLIAMINDPDPHVRSTTLHTLGDGSPRSREADVVKAMEKMYHDLDPKIRKRVRGWLAQYRRTGKVNVL